MRILTAIYTSGEEFLQAIHDGRHATIHCRTRTALHPGETVVLDVRLPGLPNPELLRAVADRPDGDGWWLSLAPDEQPTVDFLIAHAQRPVDRPELVTRHFERFPLHVRCDWRLAGTGQRIPSSTADLSSGGAFVRTPAPPPVGTAVVVALGGDEGLEITGRVVWRRAQPDDAGMGIDFAELTAPAARRLRELLRASAERGRVALSV